MNYEQFKIEWKDSMVYKPSEFDFEQTLNDYYTEYKTSLDYIKGVTVKEWCVFFFSEFDLDTHAYMLKDKALKSKHSNSLRTEANKFREGVGMPPIPLVDE